MHCRIHIFDFIFICFYPCRLIRLRLTFDYRRVIRITKHSARLFVRVEWTEQDQICTF